MPFIKVSDERRGDMLVGALEGGSNYWYYIKDRGTKIVEKYITKQTPCFSEAIWEAIKAGESIPIHDAEEDTKLGEINLKSIEAGEQIMADKYMHHFTDMIQENDDAGTADIWFQLAVMGEVVYG